MEMNFTRSPFLQVLFLFIYLFICSSYWDSYAQQVIAVCEAFLVIIIQ